MDLFVYRLERVIDNVSKVVYVSTWDLASEVISKLDGSDDHVSITRVRIIQNFYKDIPNSIKK